MIHSAWTTAETRLLLHINGWTVDPPLVNVLRHFNLFGSHRHEYTAGPFSERCHKKFDRGVKLGNGTRVLQSCLATMTHREREVTEREAQGWNPPQHFVPHLDKFILHNRQHPECNIGAIKIAQWLARNGVMVGKDCVYRWLKKRSKVLNEVSNSL
jgi:hypothetical protein